MSFYHLLVEKRWKSHPSNVQYARETVRAALHHLPHQGQIDLIELAIGEACANAVEHGSPLGERNQFLLRCSVSDEILLVFEVEDEGAEFAPTDLTLNSLPALESEGGRGLFLINQIMDQVAIRRTDQGLNVRMTKTLLEAEATSAQIPSATRSACDESVFP